MQSCAALVSPSRIKGGFTPGQISCPRVRSWTESCNRYAPFRRALEYAVTARGSALITMRESVNYRFHNSREMEQSMPRKGKLERAEPQGPISTNKYTRWRESVVQLLGARLG